MSIRYACVQGVVICWWYRAFKGSTLSRLHYDWRSGTTLRGALTAGRHTGLLALACLFSTLVVIDGPLLQRSSSVVSTPIIDHAVNLNVTMVPEIPRGYTGIWISKHDLNMDHYFNSPFNATMPAANGSVPNTIFVQPSFPQGLELAKKFYSDAPLSDIIQGCPERTCKAKLVAPALAATCSNHEILVDYNQPGGITPKQGQREAPALDRQALLATFSLVVDRETESIGMVTGFSRTHLCKGVFKYAACTLKPAIGEYEVTIERGRVTLDSPGEPAILALANNALVQTNPNSAPSNSTLAGIVSHSLGEGALQITVKRSDGSG